MKVILNQDINKKGKAGDVIKVVEGYARNYLLPRGLAIIANKYNLSKIGSIKNEAEQARLELETKYRALAQRVSEISLHFTRKADENDHLFGSVSGKDIIEALAEKEIEVHRTFLQLDTHLKNIGDYLLEINFPGEINAKLRVNVGKE
jgi:large subunit ribosomal protein L9